MTIQIGEIMIPCRTCRAAPGEDCTVTEREAKKRPGLFSANRTRHEPHKRRTRDAAKVSELLDW